MAWKEHIDEIYKRRKMAKAMGGPQAVARQHKKGRLTLRARIDCLVDKNSFHETGAGAGSPVYDEDNTLKDFEPANFILGMAKINDRDVIVGGEDFTLKGGSPNAAGLRKSVYSEEMALQFKKPLVRLHEGGGGSVVGTGDKTTPRRPSGDPVFAPSRFASIARVLGEVPVVTAALGPVAGLPAARFAASHFSVMTKNAQVLIAGPQIVQRALGEKATKETLGGPEVHLRSGVTDNIADTEEDALFQVRRFLSYLPDNAWQLPPLDKGGDTPNRCAPALASIVPKQRRRPYDMRRLIEYVCDEKSFFEMRRNYGSGLITAFARLDGKSVGVLGNDCHVYAGAMTVQAARKLRRFVDMCNSFHLPIVSFVDEPGFMIGSASEKSGTIREGVAAIAAVTQSRVPWASIIVRKVFGVAGAAHFGPQGLVLSWPSAETGALPLEGGVAVAFAREIAAAKDPVAKRRALEEELAATQSPFLRAESFGVHEHIDPTETRPRLCQWVNLATQAYQDTSPLEPYKTTMRP